VVAQATATKVPHRAASRCRPVKGRVGRVIPTGYTDLRRFLAENRLFRPDLSG